MWCRRLLGPCFNIEAVFRSMDIRIMKVRRSSDRPLYNGTFYVDNSASLYCILTLPGPGDSMMTSSNGNIFRVTGHWCGEFTGPRWIPSTKASDSELWCFLWSPRNKRLSKQSRGWWFETQSPHYNITVMSHTIFHFMYIALINCKQI